MSGPGRSAVALLAGFVTTALLSVGTDAVLHATGVYPPWGQDMSDGLYVVATAYRVAYTMLGGYLTARLAPRNPVLHAAILGGIGLLAAAAGALATQGRGPEFGPSWYPLALVATALPCVLFGAMLHRRPAPES